MFLKRYPDIEIVGEATNGEDAVLRAEELQPTIVIMDISMPKLDGIAATWRIKGNSSGLRC
jgi:DNA-binding NarL/FixJ family response regulator